MKPPAGRVVASGFSGAIDPVDRRGPGLAPVPAFEKSKSPPMLREHEKGFGSNDQIARFSEDRNLNRLVETQRHRRG